MHQHAKTNKNANKFRKEQTEFIQKTHQIYTIIVMAPCVFVARQNSIRTRGTDSPEAENNPTIETLYWDGFESI